MLSLLGSMMAFQGGELGTSGSHPRYHQVLLRSSFSFSFFISVILLSSVSTVIARAEAEEAFALTSRGRQEIDGSQNSYYSEPGANLKSVEKAAAAEKQQQQWPEQEEEEEDQQWPELKLDGGRTISAIILSSLAAVLCSAAGLGGGGLFVPLLHLLLQFDSKTSAAISNFMILGGTSIGVLLSFIRGVEHPTQLNGPLVDFNIALLLQPNMLLGISIGVILNAMLPDWLITGLLMLVLIHITVNTIKSALQRWKDETRKAIEKKNPPKRLLIRAETSSEKALTESLLSFYRSKASRFPLKTILSLLLIWLAIFAVQLLRGGHRRQGSLNLKECGLGYWLLTISQLPLAVGVTIWVGIWVVTSLPHSATAKNDLGTSDSKAQNLLLEEGYVLGLKESTVLSGMALVAGLLGGMLGIEGDMIINPLLMSVGVLPQVTVATTLFMVLSSSSMSVAQFWLMGRVPIGYAMIAGLICAVSSVVGILGLQRIISRFQRPSLIVFGVAIFIGLNALLMGVFGGWDVWNQYRSGVYMGFKYPC